MALPYRREYVRNEDGTWFGRIAEFPGCITEGDTEAEAAANLTDAMRAWLEAQCEDRAPIPPPASTMKYSGRFIVRLSPTLHRDAVACAAREQVSLNAFASMAVARAVGESTQHVSVVQYQMFPSTQIKSQISFLIDPFSHVEQPFVGMNTMPQPSATTGNEARNIAERSYESDSRRQRR